MAPKAAQSSCESGEGIFTMCRLLNGLHRPWAGLNTFIFFEEEGVHSLGHAWVSRVLIAMENNMPKANWFTPNPYSTESGVFSSKWFGHRRNFPLMKNEGWTQWINELEPIFKKKWMDNDIYKMIMLCKTTVIAKPEILTTTLLFWNLGTNTFDFRMGPMSPTILDMAQVFGLRPSSRVVDVTHNWCAPSCPIAEGSGTSDSITWLEYNSSTVKSYGPSFTGFIPFVKKNFGHSSSNANRDQEHMYFLLY